MKLLILFYFLLLNLVFCNSYVTCSNAKVTNSCVACLEPFPIQDPSRKQSRLDKILITFKCREDYNQELTINCNENSKNTICNGCYLEIDRCPLCFCGMQKKRKTITCNGIPQESKINKNNQEKTPLTEAELIAMDIPQNEINYNLNQSNKNYFVVKNRHFKLEIHKRYGLFLATLVLVSITGLGYFYKKCSSKKSLTAIDLSESI